MKMIGNSDVVYMDKFSQNTAMLPHLWIVCMASTQPLPAWAFTTDTVVRSLKGLHLALYGRSLPTPRLDHLRVSFQNKALTFFKNKTNSITEFMEV